MLLVSIVVAVGAAVGVVVFHSVATDIVAGVIVVGALAVAGRVVMRLAADGDEGTPAHS